MNILGDNCCVESGVIAVKKFDILSGDASTGEGDIILTSSMALFSGVLIDFADRVLLL